MHTLQAIYSWRGADVRNQERLDSEFSIVRPTRGVPAESLPSSAFANLPALLTAIKSIAHDSSSVSDTDLLNTGRVLELSLNYRSRQEILDAAFALLAPAYSQSDSSNQLRLVAGLTNPMPETRPPVQVVACADAEQEAEFIVNSLLQLLYAHEKAPSIAILYRTNLQSMVIERLLVRDGVSYTLAAQRSFYQRKEIRDVLAYLRLLRCNDPLAMERIINEPPRGIGKKTLEKLHAESEALGISLWEVIAHISGDSIKVSHINDLGKTARASIRRFYQLIEHYRCVVNGGAGLNQGPLFTPSAFPPIIKKNGLEEANCNSEEFQSINLTIASSEVRRTGAYL